MLKGGKAEVTGDVIFPTSLKSLDPIKVPSSEPPQSMPEPEEVKHKDISRPQALSSSSSPERGLISNLQHSLV